MRKAACADRKFGCPRQYREDRGPCSVAGGGFVLLMGLVVRAAGRWPGPAGRPHARPGRPEPPGARLRAPLSK